MHREGHCKASEAAHMSATRSDSSKPTQPSPYTEGISPLNKACRDGNLEQVQLLLSEGADPTLTDLIGYTALHCAASTNQLHVLQYLLRNSESCNVKLLSFYDETPLLVACLNNHLDAVGLLVDREADLHAVDRKENTALHLSAAGGSCAIIDYIIVEKQCTDLLNQTNRDGDTAAHYACRLGCSEALSALKRHGADMTIRNKWGYTPIQEASKRNNRDTVDRLVQSDEEKEAVRRNNCEKEMRTRSRSVPRVVKAKTLDSEQGSHSATNITVMGSGASAASAVPQGSGRGKPRSDRKKAVVSPLGSKSATYLGGRRGYNDDCASKSASNVEQSSSQNPADDAREGRYRQDVATPHTTGTPTCVYKGVGRWGTYNVQESTPVAPAGALARVRDGSREKAHSEKLPRRGREGNEGRREGGERAMTFGQVSRDQAHSELRRERKRTPDTLV